MEAIVDCFPVMLCGSGVSVSVDKCNYYIQIKVSNSRQTQIAINIPVTVVTDPSCSGVVPFGFLY